MLIYLQIRSSDVHCVSKKKMPLYFCQMLTGFLNSFTSWLSSKFLIKQYLNILPHLKCLAKWLGSKIAITQSWVKQTAAQDSSTQNSCWQIFIILTKVKYWQKGIYNVDTEKPTAWVTVRACGNQEERLRNKMSAHKINIQSMIASVGESHVVNSTPVWYLLIMESRLLRPIIVPWCCYNCSCLLYIDLKQILHFSAG